MNDAGGIETRGVETESIHERLAKSVDDELIHYFEALGLAQFLDDINLHGLIQQAITGVAKHDLVAPTSGDLTAIHRHQLFPLIARELMQISAQAMEQAFRDGDFYKGGQFFIIARECAHIAHIQMNSTQYQMAYQLVQHLSLEGRLGELIRGISHILPGRRGADRENFPASYRLCGHDRFEKLPFPILMSYAREALESDDVETALRIARIMVYKDRMSVGACVLLARCLERLGHLSEAIDVRRHIDTLPGGPSPENTRHITRLQFALSGRSATRPAQGPHRAVSTHAVAADGKSHGPITAENIATVPAGSLVVKSIKAQKRRQWDLVEMLQRELVSRQPDNIVGHIVFARALERNGKLEEALEVREKIAALEKTQGQEPDAANERIMDHLRKTVAARSQSPNTDGSTVTAHAGDADADVDTGHNGTQGDVSEGPDTSDDSGIAATHEPTATEDAELEPPKPANLDRSRFDRYLESLIREASAWNVQANGDDFWREIPEHDHDAIIQDFYNFRESLEGRGIIPKKEFGPFWKTFDNVAKQVASGKINLMALQTLQERLPQRAPFERSGITGQPVRT